MGELHPSGSSCGKCCCTSHTTQYTHDEYPHTRENENMLYTHMAQSTADLKETGDPQNHSNLQRAHDERWAREKTVLLCSWAGIQHAALWSDRMRATVLILLYFGRFDLWARLPSVLKKVLQGAEKMCIYFCCVGCSVGICHIHLRVWLNSEVSLIFENRAPYHDLCGLLCLLIFVLWNWESQHLLLIFWYLLRKFFS